MYLSKIIINLSNISYYKNYYSNSLNRSLLS